MIARFMFELPIALSIRPSDDLQPLSIEHSSSRCRISLRQQPLPDGRIRESKLSMDALVIDDEATYLADTLCIDLIGEFDRGEGTIGPEYGVALEVAKRVISLFRSLARAPFVLPPDENSRWRVRYLQDDETEFEQIAGLLRGKGKATTGLIHRAWVAPEIWESLATTKHSPPPSDELILDAFNLWPHVGASLALAYTAIEVRIATALDALVQRSVLPVDASVWAWINDRGGNYLKEPSVEEQLSILLSFLSGRSLKDEPELWRAYTDLRKARNSFAHEGKAKLPGSATVTPATALELIRRAQGIIQWIEVGLLEEERAPSVAMRERTRKILIAVTE